MKKWPSFFVVLMLMVLLSAAVAATTYYTYVLSWGSFGTGNGQFRYPHNVVTDAYGNVYVSDYWNNRIEKFDSNGHFLAAWGSSGSGNGQFNDPSGEAVDSGGNLYVADSGNNRIQKFSPAGAWLANIGSGQLSGPDAVAVDSSGYIYAADTGNTRIAKFDSNGNMVAQWNNGNYGCDPAGWSCGYQFYPTGLAVDATGHLYVSDSSTANVEVFTTSGVFVSQFGHFSNPQGIALDSSGNVFVSDTGNNRIVEYSTSGVYETEWGSQGSGEFQFSSPWDVTVDPSGNVYVADSSNARIVKYAIAQANLSISGIVETIGSTGISGATVSVSGPVTATTATDGNGNYSFAGLPPGVYTVTASAAGLAFNHLSPTVTSSLVDENFIATNLAENYTVTAQSGSNGMLTATLLYQDAGGVVHPIDNAYAYLQGGNQLSPREKYFRNAPYIVGPTNANGYISASVPAGTYHLRLLRRAPLGTTPAQSQLYGPPRAGDYTWNFVGPTVSIGAGKAVNFGAAYASTFGPITITGRVYNSSTGQAKAGWYVKASTQQCQDVESCEYCGGPQYYISDPNANCGTKYPAQNLTDANGNYTIKLKNPGTYYIYACQNPGTCHGLCWQGACNAGGYGTGSGGNIAPITVGKGQSLTGVNISGNF